MHNICLGVVKTLLNYWINTVNKPYSLTNAQKMEIDYRINAVKYQICSEFVRRPRPLKEFKYYKASEYRFILLYLGPFIFLNVVDKRFFDHFLKLHAAIGILCHPVLHKTKNDIAKNLLHAFGHEFQMLYGEQFFVYNFHLATHLADDAVIHGNLDAFSAFPFENYLRILLTYIRKAPFPLHQLKNRLGEKMKYYTYSKKKIFRQKHGSYCAITTKQDVLITTEPNDNFVYHNGYIYQAKNIRKHGDIFMLECNLVVNIVSLFVDPVTSKSIGVYCCDKISLRPSTVQINADNCTKVLHIKLDVITGLIVIMHKNH
ncbi:uncharacterized protein LOC129774558 [Toxorhynchites rutilus septentrionalis]|uniref:uncharacterized protein LOC129774558 n=1 Tax=Toxorhynchites rutilus septentrionalis TaxID=329112 RepID=UPI00247A576C|nr:uncharacterized protein LOC129774558 [Toxorhynchites rutilus septentrionalis]